MSYLDKTFCASPDCKNECGRKMTNKEWNNLQKQKEIVPIVSYSYFCGQPSHARINNIELDINN